MKTCKRRSAGTASLAIRTAAATAIFGEPVRRWLSSRGRYDVPNHRSSHQLPVPRGGGLAALLGTASALLSSDRNLSSRATAAVGGIALLGWLDDTLGHVPAPVRLACQLGLGGAFLTPPRGSFALSAFATAGIVNVVNFMDGINGISGLTSIIWGGNAILAAEHPTDDLSTLGAIAVGAGVGFLPYNIPQGRLFLGDVGSYALGAAFAAGILSQSGLEARYRAGAPLLPYAADAIQAIISRSANGEQLTEPHRRHVYQRLVDSGYSHHTVATLHAVAAATVAASARLPGIFSMLVPCCVCTCYVRLPELLSGPSRVAT